MKSTESGENYPQKYPKEQARAIFRKALKDGGYVSGKHDRLRQRQKNIDNNDILNLGKTGLVIREPELDVGTNKWKYTIESQGEGGLKAVFNILDECRVRIITVMWG